MIFKKCALGSQKEQKDKETKSDPSIIEIEDNSESNRSVDCSNGIPVIHDFFGLEAAKGANQCNASEKKIKLIATQQKPKPNEEIKGEIEEDKVPTPLESRPKK